MLGEQNWIRCWTNRTGYDTGRAELEKMLDKQNWTFGLVVCAAAAGAKAGGLLLLLLVQKQDIVAAAACDFNRFDVCFLKKTFSKRKNDVLAT